jgi:hypothetical protein
MTVIFLLGLTVVATADITMSYAGETPIGSGHGNEGITGLNTGDDTLWDYVYNLEGFTNTPSDPIVWAIHVTYEPVNMTMPTGWDSVVYDDEVTAGEYGTVGSGDFEELIGRSAVVWQKSTFDVSWSGFSFQSILAPHAVRWETAGSGSNTGIGMEYSAAPEPGTILLTSLGLLGIGAWRRRRNSV